MLFSRCGVNSGSSLFAQTRKQDIKPLRLPRMASIAQTTVAVVQTTQSHGPSTSEPQTGQRGIAGELNARTALSRRNACMRS